jgi:hypothetical protein
MERRLMVEVNDVVVLNKDVEVVPTVIIGEGTVGSVIEETAPYYFRVKFFGNKVYWVDGKHLDVIIK